MNISQISSRSPQLPSNLEILLPRVLTICSPASPAKSCPCYLPRVMIKLPRVGRYFGFWRRIKLAGRDFGGEIEAKMAGRRSRRKSKSRSKRSSNHFHLIAHRYLLASHLSSSSIIGGIDIDAPLSTSRSRPLGSTSRSRPLGLPSSHRERS